MQVVTLSEKAKRLEARKRALGITPAQLQAAQNSGKGRTPEKRALLRLLDEVARKQGRALPFAANY